MPIYVSHIYSPISAMPIFRLSARFFRLIDYFLISIFSSPDFLRHFHFIDMPSPSSLSFRLSASFHFVITRFLTCHR